MRRSLRAGAAAAMAGVSLAACGTASSQASSADPVAPPVAPPPPPTAASPAPPPSPAGQARADAVARPTRLSKGWRITVYYTAVESFHTGPRKRVRGCLVSGCARPKADLGSYPAGFVKAVQTEGAGRITSGPYKGRYLTWSRRVGHFWLDEVARDAVNRPLRPWVTAAADRSVLERGSRFTITGCGKGWAGRPVPTATCERFRAARWTVVDVFAPGHGGEHHADVYIGEETGPGFTTSPFYTTLNGATLGLE
ncbi:hypothetical protein SAMN04489712_10842 [Thermomonospora echinospora]|uniref:Lipoprotein n=1 Tax=Thermomonospora echinospora TaxID=1992 RepID=A0A1H6BVF6_9ACTN|nr:hypothetical protein [Thermomonospora echinospora]SEG64643.1 hypothetical protein SAMN04489712_10842 [Thermomonospora echinospora]